MSFPGLGMGITFASFHELGMMFLLSVMLKSSVRYVTARGPRCFRCLMFMLSGPVELLFLDCLMASSVCAVVICIWVVGSLFVCLSIFLLFGSVLCLMTFVNCLLNSAAFCLFVMAVVFLKVMVVLGFGLGFLFVRLAIVFHST